MIVLLMTFCSLSAGPQPTRADAIHTSDGSRIVGTIDILSEGKLIFLSNIAGKLEVDVAQLVAIESESDLNVEFDSGDRLVGHVTIHPGENRSVVHTSLGAFDFAADKIKSVWPVGADSPEVIAIKKDEEKKRQELIPEWTVSLQAGAIRNEGNTDNLSAHGRFDLKRKTKSDLLSFYLYGQYAEQNDLRTENEYGGGINYEYNLTDRWYWYTRLDLEHDEFEDLDLRTTVATGVGYYWIKKDDHEFKTRAGVGHRHESYDTGLTTDEVILDLGMDYRIDLADWVQFVHSATYSPAFEDFDDYRLNFDTAVVFPLKKDVWKLKIGMRNEYNSMPRGNNEALDNTYYTDIVMELKRKRS
jgi:putative salt-induced outer membrane protein YdiY